MRNVLATVCWRFGSWGLVIKLIFCSDFGFVWPPQTNFRFPSVGSFSGAHPSFWPFRASELLVPLILDRGQWNLVGPTGPSKKMSHNDNRPGPGQKYRQMSIFKFGRKALFGQKSIFFQKVPKICKFIWEKGTFLFAQLCLVVARTWLRPRSEVFFWTKNTDFGLKIRCFALGPWISLMASLLSSARRSI